jgi:hypothetical protein
MPEAETILQGGCLCGAIRYRITGPVRFVSQCACRDCQKATGTGHTTILGVDGADLAVTGTPSVYTSRGQTGGKVSRHFCPTCAGRLYTTGDHPGRVVIVQAGSLDDPNAVYPENVIYAADAPKWDFFDPALPRFEGMIEREGMGK